MNFKNNEQDQPKLIFPPNFLWGAATSGIQNEGLKGRAPTVWEASFDQKKELFDQEVGPQVTSNFVDHYQEDIRLAKKMNLNSLRISIEWSRIIKNFVTNEVNPEGIAFYQKVLTELKANQIEPLVCLNHWGTPLAIEEQGGWIKRETIDHFVAFAKIVIRQFSPLVKKWFTFNEPTALADQPYLYQRCIPFEVDFAKAVQAGFHVNLASARVIQYFKKHHYPGKIGMIIAMSPYYPRSQAVQDLKAAQIAEDLLHNSFLYPAIKGYFPNSLIEFLKSKKLMPQIKPNDLVIIKQNTIDILGANYYYPIRIKAKESKITNLHAPNWYFDFYQNAQGIFNRDRGWEIYPRGIYDLGMKIKNEFNNIEWFIAENGIGIANEAKYRAENGIIDDQYRIDFYQAHLFYLHRLITKGGNCQGFIAWNLLDNWSWLNGYKNRYGFIELKLKTQKRVIKKSFQWMAKITQDNAIVNSLPKNME